MAGIANAGYMGIAELGGTSVRCTSFNVNPVQSLLFYNHVIGLKDTVPSDNSTKGEDLSAMNIQRNIWRPSTFIASGGISFPMTEYVTDYTFNTARNANYFDANFIYYCGGSREVSECRVNTFDLTATAGEVVNISMNVMGKKITDGSGFTSYRTPEKLLTWDKVKVTAPGITSGAIQSFSLKINNNLKPIYVTGDGSLEGLRPIDIRVGMQEVSGSLAVYIKSGQTFINPGSMVTISVSLGLTLSLGITAVFTPSSMEGAVGPFITTVPFTAVDYYFT